MPKSKKSIVTVKKDYNDISELKEIVNSNKIFLLSDEVAKFVSLSPQNLREQAKNAPEKLGFNVIVAGTQIRIPRIPFLEFMGIYDTGGTEV